MSKLYTEEQLREALKFARYSTGNLVRTNDQIVESLTPIQLPTDEEVEKFAQQKYHDVEDSRWFEPLQVGAKWMRDKIKGGEK